LTDGVEVDLAELLALEELDTDLYRGLNESDARWRPALFGGQVAAQALRAAAYTVPEGRIPHSLHGYFLRPGKADRLVILRVTRDRDGKSFSARHVVAVQNGEVIFSMSASFHQPRPGSEYEIDHPLPEAGPEELEQSPFLRAYSPLDVRVFPPLVPAEPEQIVVPARLWARAKHQLADDPIVHACALTYLSDLGSGFGDGQAAGLPRGGPTIDHAVWFHHPVRLDDWVLLETWPLKAGGSRGLYTGRMRDRAGHLAAMLTQEILFWDPDSDRRRRAMRRPPAP
jgi:acyl-CoA thioesterase II